MQYKSGSLSSRAMSLGVAALILGLLVGCDVFDLNKSSENADSYPLRMGDSTEVEPGLEIELLTPDTVALGDPFRMEIRTNNLTGHSVSVVSGSACMYRFGLYHDDEAVPVEGAGRLCATVQTEISVPPGDRVKRYDLRAVRASNHEAPISSGAYTARVMLNWRIEGTAVKDTLETTVLFSDE